MELVNYKNQPLKNFNTHIMKKIFLNISLSVYFVPVKGETVYPALNKSKTIYYKAMQLFLETNIKQIHPCDYRPEKI